MTIISLLALEVFKKKKKTELFSPRHGRNGMKSSCSLIYLSLNFVYSSKPDTSIDFRHFPLRSHFKGANILHALCNEPV